MEYTYHDLKEKKVSELREIASGMEHEALKGYTQLNKEHLIAALCTALGIDTHEHHKAVGIDKSSIKTRIHELKKKRNEALEGHDHKTLKIVRRKIHHLKRAIRKATV
jgi:rubrerythrin